MFDLPAVLFNNQTIAAKSAIWFGDQLEERNNGAQAPSNLLGAFFTPEGFLYGGVHGETFGSAGFAVGVRRFANPVYAVTIFFGEKWCRFGLNQNENTNMIPDFPVDDVSLRVNRALSITRLLQVSAEYSDLFQIQGEDAQQVLWVIEQALLEAQASIDAWCDARLGGRA